MIDKFLSHPAIRTLTSNKKYFLWLTGVSALLGAVLFFITPKQFQSTSLLFPARQFSVSKLVIEENAGNQSDYMHFGYTDDSERLIDILNSESLKLEIARAFNLWERWEIKENQRRLNNLQEKWDEMVEVRKTEYNSVRVDVFDYTAEGAAELVNGIVQYADTIKFKMNKPVVDYVLKVVKAEYDSTQARLKILQDSLHSLRLRGVLHYKEMLKAFMKRYTLAVSKADIAGMRRLETELDTLRKYGSAYLYVQDQLEMYSTKYPDIRMKYDEAMVNAENQLPVKFVIESGVADNFSVRPRPFIFILSIVFLSDLVLFILLFYWQEIRHTLRIARQYAKGSG